MERKDGRIKRSGKEGWEDLENWKGRMGGYSELERKDGRIKRSVKEVCKDLEKWKGRMGEYSEVKRKEGGFREVEWKDGRI